MQGRFCVDNEGTRREPAEEEKRHAGGSLGWWSGFADGLAATLHRSVQGVAASGRSVATAAALSRTRAHTGEGKVSEKPL